MGVVEACRRDMQRDQEIIAALDYEPDISTTWALLDHREAGTDAGSGDIGRAR